MKNPTELIKAFKAQCAAYDMGKQVGPNLVRFLVIDEETGKIRSWHEVHNTVVYQGADVMAMLATSAAKLSHMYFEYENLAAPGDPVPSPSVGRDKGLDYFTDDLSASQDVLRVPLVIAAELVSSDEAKYDGNQANFFAITSGQSEGAFKDLPFSEANNSAVYGSALVLARDADDHLQDLVFARTYTSIGKLLKEPGAQIGIQWFVRWT